MPNPDPVGRARNAGVAWILGHLQPNGEPLEGYEGDQYWPYYRLPWALAAAGERVAAAGALSWIERNALTASGDLRPGPAQGVFTGYWSSYPLAVIATGAWHLERYDTALAIIRKLRALPAQDPHTGGAYTERPEVRTTGRQELVPTAGLGLAALTTGQLDIAQKAFSWIRNLYEAQPDLPRRLYTAWGADGLMTDVEDELEYQLITRFDVGRQASYNPGIAAAFLGRYFMQTGETKARDLGSRFLRLNVEGTLDQFDHSESKQICKFGWGSAVMLEADPEGDHRGHVVRMAQWFVDSQLDDGHWENSPWLIPRPTLGDGLDVTCEFVSHLNYILAALGPRGPDYDSLTEERPSQIATH